MFISHHSQGAQPEVWIGKGVGAAYFHCCLQHSVCISSFTGITTSSPSNYSKPFTGQRIPPIQLFHVILAVSRSLHGKVCNSPPCMRCVDTNKTNKSSGRAQFYFNKKQVVTFFYLQADPWAKEGKVAALTGSASLFLLQFPTLITLFTSSVRCHLLCNHPLAA